MVDQADMEARARYHLGAQFQDVHARWAVQYSDEPAIIGSRYAIDAMLAYAAEREAAAYDRAAEVVTAIADEPPSQGDTGQARARQLAGRAFATAILSLREGKG